MLLLRACPRCQGDLELIDDEQGAFLSCLQCGHILSRVEERELGVRATHHGISHVRNRELMRDQPRELVANHPAP